MSPSRFNWYGSEAWVAVDDEWVYVGEIPTGPLQIPLEEEDIEAIIEAVEEFLDHNGSRWNE